MEMTIEQRRDYDKLTKEQKEYFAFFERQKPNWTFSQVMAKVQFNIIMDDPKGPLGDCGDVDPHDPAIWLTILGGVKVALSKFKSISDSITNAINGAISSLKQMISLGIRKVGNAIEKILDSIF
ncbi:MAG: hypothetical protein MJZ62_05180 [Bacteroidales bacterium]|nr:hypothetical protein [Bacteroidales bacterium]